jgi:adenylate cyclase
VTTASHAGTRERLVGQAIWIATIVAPLAGLLLLLAAPDFDVEWEHHPGHFWLVFGVALLTAALALLMNDAARRRVDARVLFVSLGFLVAAGSLGLHAVATPDVLLDRANAGFELDVPIGLVVAGALFVISSFELPGARVARMGLPLTVALLGAFAVWALASLVLLDEPLSTSTRDGAQVALAVVGLLLYAWAAVRYYLLLRRRRSWLLVALVTAFVLLSEAMIAVAFARNWHASWWEWHLLVLVAFAVVAASVWAEWRAEGASADVFGDVYLAETSAGLREVSVLFADLRGFTSFAERSSPHELFAMLNTYFDAVVPAIAQREGGTIDKLMGDAIMVTFNTRGDQPDHALRAARAGLALQEEGANVHSTRPDWPRFRVGINSGVAVVGLVGPRGARSYTVIGDVVNVASRLEGSAEVGEVVIGEATRDALGSRGRAEPLGEIALKGKAETVNSFRLLSVSSS